MKSIATLVLLASFGVSAVAQTDTITNAGFERWGNASPGVSTEPTSWYSDQSGGGFADLGPQTCFQDDTAYTGSYCVRVVTENSLIGGAVNGVVTTGVVNAPTTSKSDGYIGTLKYVSSGTTTDDRRMPFTGRPDSLTGWYKYYPGGSGEQGKIRSILHINDYYDPETPTTYHPDPTANRIADDTFFTPMSVVSTWTRFAVPYTYVSSASPTYIMINVTSSANQTTTVDGSTLWLDALAVVYNPCGPVAGLTASSITATTATISWTANATGYVYAVDNNPTPPTSGTYTTSNSVPLTGLTAGTTYYAHVYDSCSVGIGESVWMTISFATTSASGCNAPTGLSVGTITSSSAVINWTPASGALGSEYVINTTAASPTTSGTGTTAATYTATGLSASTMYYAHVLDSCSATSLSAWVSIPFTTSTTGINNVTNGGFSITAFPNPVQDELTIRVNGAASGATGQVQLIDISGRLLKTIVADAGTLNMSMNGLSSGIYLIRYTDAEHTQTIKINKE